MTILITGAAGFIGFHLAQRLLADGHPVVGLDSFTPYYDVTLKQARWAQLTAHSGFQGYTLDLQDRPTLEALFADHSFTHVVHLAAQAGVRYSVEHPDTYISTNIGGTYNLLEVVRAYPVQHLLLASTSSVYGGNTPPFAETNRTDHPVSLYAATKKATEDLSHSTAHLWKQPISALRFFTVYGPWGRPDMALFKFTRAILAGEPIELYNHGAMIRDFTYVGDVVESIVRLLPCVPVAASDNGGSPVAPFRAVNIASGRPVALRDYVAAIEQATGREAQRVLRPMQPGDVQATHGKIDVLGALTSYRPSTSIQEGVTKFVSWYRDYYQV